MPTHSSNILPRACLTLLVILSLIHGGTALAKGPEAQGTRVDRLDEGPLMMVSLGPPNHATRRSGFLGAAKAEKGPLAVIWTARPDTPTRSITLQPARNRGSSALGSKVLVTATGFPDGRTRWLTLGRMGNHTPMWTDNVSNAAACVVTASPDGAMVIQADSAEGPQYLSEEDAAVVSRTRLPAGARPASWSGSTAAFLRSATGLQTVRISNSGSQTVDATTGPIVLGAQESAGAFAAVWGRGFTASSVFVSLEEGQGAMALVAFGFSDRKTRWLAARDPGSPYWSEDPAAAIRLTGEGSYPANSLVSTAFADGKSRTFSIRLQGSDASGSGPWPAEWTSSGRALVQIEGSASGATASSSLPAYRVPDAGARSGSRPPTAFETECAEAARLLYVGGSETLELVSLEYTARGWARLSDALDVAGDSAASARVRSDRQRVWNNLSTSPRPPQETLRRLAGDMAEALRVGGSIPSAYLRTRPAALASLTLEEQSTYWSGDRLNAPVMDDEALMSLAVADQLLAGRNPSPNDPSDALTRAFRAWLRLRQIRGPRFQEGAMPVISHPFATNATFAGASPEDRDSLSQGTLQYYIQLVAKGQTRSPSPAFKNSIDQTLELGRRQWETGIGAVLNALGAGPARVSGRAGLVKTLTDGTRVAQKQFILSFRHNPDGTVSYAGP